MITEKSAAQLEKGDVIIAKSGGKRYEIVGIMAGLGGIKYPYLTLVGDSGVEFEHDTSLDSSSATYTVETKGVS